MIYSEVINLMNQKYIKILLGLIGLFITFGDISCYGNEPKNKIINNEIISSKVFEVIDGDTIKNKVAKIRLYGFDAPELDQKCKDENKKSWDCGRVSKAKLEKMIKGKLIKCKIKGHDKYKRKLGICYNGEDEINRLMVKQGYAVSYPKYRGRYELDEEYAINNNIGIWQGEFEEPEEYRKKRKKESLSKTSKTKISKRYEKAKKVSTKKIIKTLTKVDKKAHSKKVKRLNRGNK